MSEIATTFAIIGVIVVLFIWGRLPVEVAAIGAAGLMRTSRRDIS